MRSCKKGVFCMKVETKEWISKAEGDFHDVLRGIRLRG
jgi:hypothetical protein